MDKSETKTPFWKNKHNLISFVAGMVVMLLITAGITSAVNPSFFTGTMANKSEIIVYRMFPDKVSIPDMQSSQLYLGEIKLLPLPKGNFAVIDSFSSCEGQLLRFSQNAALFSILGGDYGCSGDQFGIPDLKNSSSVSGFAYYIATSGYYPYPADNEKTVSGQIAYVPYIFSDDGYYNEFSVIGELVLVKTSNSDSLNGKFIPCEGQTLNSWDYPALSSALGSDAATFKLPDLRSLSPVDGAQYCVSTIGLYVYYDPIPDGMMRCNSCGSVVPRTKFCCECGARNNYY